METPIVLCFLTQLVEELEIRNNHTTIINALPLSEHLLEGVLFSQLGKKIKGTAKIFFPSWEKISPQYGIYAKK